MRHSDYPGNWPQIRVVILDRDEHFCRMFNCFSDGGGRGLEIHHIDFRPSNNVPENLVTFCSVCHRAVHSELYKPSDWLDWPPPWGEHPTLELGEFIELTPNKIVPKLRKKKGVHKLADRDKPLGVSKLFCG